MPDPRPDFPPTRAAGLAALAAFVPRAGRDYAALRNLDLPGHPHVSRLSPYLRHRLVTEAEVLAAVLARHSAAEAGKFVGEVFWRTYWKGWLELRPAVWEDYRAGLRAALNRVQTEAGLRRAWEAACRGETGIDGFDGWARELAATGYLHNHARMWFASIWIFTLRLPWELGADFFLRHLLDGDPASNTLSWRWVAGLHTRGKTYLATAGNIARFTAGRARPSGLAAAAPPLEGPPPPPPGPAPAGDAWAPAPGAGLLLTEDDLAPEFLLDAGLAPAATAFLLGHRGRSPLAIAEPVAAFTEAAAADCARRLGPRLGPVAGPFDSPADVATWARSAGLRRVVMPWAPAGPAAALAAGAARALAAEGIALSRALRPFDAAAWPQATHGFFRFREAIPGLLARLGLTPDGTGGPCPGPSLPEISSGGVPAPRGRGADGPPPRPPLRW
jgi:deoxyribodipyrimidine photo-lyase